ncbi:hypothetical protein PG988_010350 [Apiospora saccharicola]
METQLTISPRKAEAPVEFHPFPRLPIELRIQIWEELIPEIHDRIIWVRDPGWIKVDKTRFSSILLRVSPESRDVYLMRFPMPLTVCNYDMWLNPNKNCPLQTDWTSRGVVHINPEHDILAIGQP